VPSREVATAAPASEIHRPTITGLLAGHRAAAARIIQTSAGPRFAAELSLVFLAYYIAGELGQATTNIRSSNLGPVWPAYGIALAAVLALGPRVWPAIAASALAIAGSSSVPLLAATGQALGATVAALIGAALLRRIPSFDPSLSRLRDALGLIVVGAFGSALISASIGTLSLFAFQVQPYSGLGSAWLIYWLGDSTGVLLVTPLVFTLPRLIGRVRVRKGGSVALLALLLAACSFVFGDLPLFSVRLHVLAFAVLPFVMWAAIDFGIGGASLAVFIIATVATLSTALGLGPFAGSTPLINALLLDLLFVVLSVSGLTLAAVITERENTEAERQRLVREQVAAEARLHLATIVESSDDAIYSKGLDSIVLSWNAAAERTFGFTAAEMVGRSATTLIPDGAREEESMILERLKAGGRMVRYETTRVKKSGVRIDVSMTISPLTDARGRVVGAAAIVRDISEQKRVQRALSSVSRRLIHAQEEERARIARELHDDIGQRLALLSFNLGALPGASSAALDTARLYQQVSEIASDIHSLSHELHSSKLELLGLARAMQSFCRDFAQQQHVTVDFTDATVSAKFPSTVSLSLFRVLQEAVRNGVKHGRAPRFDVRLSESDGFLSLLVKDQGEGFDLGAARASPGLGLISMEERLKLVDGELSIETQPGQGTSIHARVRLSPVRGGMREAQAFDGGRIVGSA
jgi:PAS domain S-box-containing protein